MGENTKISWATHTWSPWQGCTHVGPACDHCYAEALMDHRFNKVKWGAGEDRVKASAHTWNEPLRWDRKAASAGKIDTVFCLSLGDIWDNEVDPMWRREAFDVMRKTPNLVYLLLSKRIGNATKMCGAAYSSDVLPENAALGATMVNQDEWDRDMPKLRETARILEPRFTFASIEPMLGPIDMRGDLPDWIIVGGESGTQARPTHPDWIRSIRDQCAAASVSFHFKQHGEFIGVQDLRRLPGGDGPGFGAYDHCQFSMEHDAVRVGKARAGRLLDGQEHNGFPNLRG